MTLPKNISKNNFSIELSVRGVWSAIAMSLSSVIVILNSLRLEKSKI